MKRVLYLFMALICSSAVAQSEINIKLWDENQPTHKSTLSGDEIEDAAHFFTNVSVGEIFVYPAQGENSGRAAIICPGGGYSGVSMGSEGKDCAKLLADNGITAIVLKYRLPNGDHNVTMEDADRAFEIVNDNASQWGVDTTKIGVIGFSAGGHLASTIAVRKNPAFAVLFYPVISSDPDVCHMGSFKSLTGGDETLNRYYSNELHVTPKTPPTLMFHSADDTAVSIKNSFLFNDALLKNGVFSQLVIFSSGNHGWGMLPRLKESDYMKCVMIDFIKKYEY